MVDREDDLKIGVKSSAILFADMDRFLIGVMQLMMLGALILVGRNMHFGNWYYASVAGTAILFLWQQWLIRKREPAGCLRFAAKARDWKKRGDAYIFMINGAKVRAPAAWRCWRWCGPPDRSGGPSVSLRARRRGPARRRPGGRLPARRCACRQK